MSDEMRTGTRAVVLLPGAEYSDEESPDVLIGVDGAVAERPCMHWILTSASVPIDFASLQGKPPVVTSREIYDALRPDITPFQFVSRQHAWPTARQARWELHGSTQALVWAFRCGCEQIDLYGAIEDEDEQAAMAATIAALSEKGVTAIPHGEVTPDD